jgi:sugar-phosphatase
LLFDLDGVLVDSRICDELVWRSWAAQRGVDPDPMIRAGQGRRASETLREVAPDLDAAAEAAVIDAMEERETSGLRAVAGAASLLAQLEPTRWGIVTSASRRVANLRLMTAGLPIPAVFITRDLVERGKPDPQGYLWAAASLRVEPADAVVFEDAPAGIAAARAGGMRVVGIATTHAPAAIAAADLVVPDLSALRLAGTTDEWIEIGVAVPDERA